MPGQKGRTKGTWRMHSVESRFIAIVIGALLVFVAPLFVLFLVLSSDRVARERLQHTEVLLQANVQALGKPIWDFDHESTHQIVKALRAGSDHYLTKPLNIDQFLHVMQQAASAGAEGSGDAR